MFQWDATKDSIHNMFSVNHLNYGLELLRHYLELIAIDSWNGTFLQLEKCQRSLQSQRSLR